MQWAWFDKISQQLTVYGTFFGQAWYIIVFMFRLIVVIGLGGSVYGDEQSGFKCSTEAVGCTNACYNQFTQISQIRFWAFQMIAIITPVILFHFFASYITGLFEKAEKTQGQLEHEQKGDFRNPNHREWEKRKMEQRRKRLGKVKVKNIFDGNEIKNVPITVSIGVVYFITTVLRMIAEGIFLWLTKELYDYPDYLQEVSNNVVSNHPIFQQNQELQALLEKPDSAPLDYLWAEFPAVYPCGYNGLESPVYLSCFQHLAFGNQVVIPCWTSRYWEKTLFLRYMNALSAACFLLCALELVFIPVKYGISYVTRRSVSNKGGKNNGPGPDSSLMVVSQQPNGNSKFDDFQNSGRPPYPPSNGYEKPPPPSDNYSLHSHRRDGDVDRHRNDDHYHSTQPPPIPPHADNSSRRGPQSDNYQQTRRHDPNFIEFDNSKVVPYPNNDRPPNPPPHGDAGGQRHGKDNYDDFLKQTSQDQLRSQNSIHGSSRGAEYAHLKTDSYPYDERSRQHHPPSGEHGGQRRYDEDRV